MFSLQCVEIQCITKEIEFITRLFDVCVTFAWYGDYSMRITAFVPLSNVHAHRDTHTHSNPRTHTHALKRTYARTLHIQTDETKGHNFKFSFNKSLGHVERKQTQYQIFRVESSLFAHATDYDGKRRNICPPKYSEQWQLFETCMKNTHTHTHITT